MSTIPSDSQTTDPVVDRFTLTATNGEPIAVERRAPRRGVARAAVVIAPAMATRARFYVPLADWLSTHGVVVYTFDYQGHGASARTPLPDVTADFLTWGDDAATVATWVRADTDLPLTWVGHSLGGQLLAFTPPGTLDAAIIVASGTGYWRNAEGRDRLLAPLLWYVIAPTLTRLFGYYPGKRVRLLGDIPGPVMRQWATWCKHPDYILGILPEYRDVFAAVEIPVTSLSFTDDQTMSRTATAHLESFYTGADLTPLRVSPAELGTHRIGHMGLFYRDRQPLWERTILPLIKTP